MFLPAVPLPKSKDVLESSIYHRVKTFSRDSQTHFLCFHVFLYCIIKCDPDEGVSRNILVNVCLDIFIFVAPCFVYINHIWHKVFAFIFIFICCLYSKFVISACLDIFVTPCFAYLNCILHKDLCFYIFTSLSIFIIFPFTFIFGLI